MVAHWSDPSLVFLLMLNWKSISWFANPRGEVVGRLLSVVNILITSLQEPERDFVAPILLTSARDAPTPRSPTPARDVTVPNTRTTVEDIPISQVSANDTSGTKPLVDVHTSKPRLKPRDPNANEVALRLPARLSWTEGCSLFNILMFTNNNNVQNGHRLDFFLGQEY